MDAGNYSMKSLLAWLAAAALGSTIPGAAALAAESGGPAVMRVVTIQTSDLKTYAHELSVEEGMLRRVGVNCTFKVWQAHYAGSDTGTVVVALEFASWDNFSRYLSAGQMHPDLGAQMAKFNPSLRKVVSDSVYLEVPPG
jgi:hypothetical protein